MSSLTIVHTNDLHGASQPLERLAGEARSQALLLDSGDAIAGSNTAFFLNEPNLARMSQLGYRAMAMGNREFHYLRRVLAMRARQRNFPLLAANLVDLRGQSEGLFQSHLSLDWQGIKVAIFGATVVQYPVGSRWERLTGFRFLAPELCLPPLVSHLRANHDLVIFLSHLGLDVDRRLAPRLEVDLVLGGHTHDLLEQPEHIGKSWLFQGGSHGGYFGRIHLDLSDQLQVSYELVRCAR
ncbi:MAG: metallophosphoesterase [Candidatus Eremiobacteraeota bacterium]|nr:metallophosphoesterase [Candidatus Eremiobacteraeota bacterium]